MLAWSTLAWRTSEMLMASAQVIAHRCARMAVAGASPVARDRREFARMGPEKLAAAAECTSAVAAHVAVVNVAAATRLWRDACAVGLDVALLATSTTPAQALHRQQRLLQSLTRASVKPAELAGALADLSGKALDPLHRRTAANLARLRR
jgi:hypothetical protein